MKVLSVNVAAPREIIANGKSVRTAIFKAPVDGRVALRRLGLEGDDQADKRVHGGLDQAVYAYDHSYYQQWQESLGRTDFEYGQFGENLTVKGLLDNEVCIGDVLSIGTAEVQVSHPRTPCFKLGLKMGDPTFVKAFLESCCVGFYLRVLEEGEVPAGDEIVGVRDQACDGDGRNERRHQSDEAEEGDRRGKNGNVVAGDPVLQPSEDPRRFG